MTSLLSSVGSLWLDESERIDLLHIARIGRETMDPLLDPTGWSDKTFDFSINEG